MSRRYFIAHDLNGKHGADWAIFDSVTEQITYNFCNSLESALYYIQQAEYDSASPAAKLFDRCFNPGGDYYYNTLTLSECMNTTIYIDLPDGLRYFEQEDAVQIEPALGDLDLQLEATYWYDPDDEDEDEDEDDD